MRIDKQEVVDVLNDRGDHTTADRAGVDLPQQVDTERNRGELDALGVDPRELTGGEGVRDTSLARPPPGQRRPSR